MATTFRTHFRIGTVIGLNFRDGCGVLVGVITGESFKYSAADGQEHTFFQVTPAPAQGLDDPFQITLDEAFVYGVALPSNTLADVIAAVRRDRDETPNADAWLALEAKAGRLEAYRKAARRDAFLGN